MVLSIGSRGGQYPTNYQRGGDGQFQELLIQDDGRPAHPHPVSPGYSVQTTHQQEGGRLIWLSFEPEWRKRGGSANFRSLLECSVGLCSVKVPLGAMMSCCRMVIHSTP
ncbi:uncharacterized protein CIMG_12698 [Coccidioides immitis RS]|uniref:Uncharacterized protein n=1 Tax=Coccidioides immitis (strain RS) TaxID=246410 RepID=A0A0D8JRX1_COCIM|nr:uncharacterized protein CIMG_12698 [Coccidioides immitis RS]KJF60037.1 hypothetical protein CIMG_12698 [Coccidioides immitis RS]